MSAQVLNFPRVPKMASINSNMNVKIDESQLQRFEDCITRFEKATKQIPRKTIKSTIMDLFFGRMALVGIFAGYMFLQNGLPDFSKVQKEVLKFDEQSGIITLKVYDELENYIFKDGKIMDGGKEVNDSYAEKIKHAILLDTPFPVEKGIFW